MTGGEHEQVHRDLGVYVLGALDPGDRDRLELHLAGCDSCRDELASLALLPSLLTRAAPDAVDVPPLPAIAPIVKRVAAERRKARRRTGVLAGTAAVAAAVAVWALLSAGWFVPAQTTDQFVADIPGVTASVDERSWGMAVSISADELPAHDGYVAVAVTDSGHRTQVASWTATGGPVEVDGSCYLAPSQVDRMEILGAPGDQVLAVLRPDTS